MRYVRNTVNATHPLLDFVPALSRGWQGRAGTAARPLRNGPGCRSLSITKIRLGRHAQRLEGSELEDVVSSRTGRTAGLKVCSRHTRELLRSLHFDSAEGDIPSGSKRGPHTSLNVGPISLAEVTDHSHL